MEIAKVAVIGAVIMGRGIAQVVATAGCESAIRDIRDEILENAKAGTLGNPWIVRSRKRR